MTMSYRMPSPHRRRAQPVRVIATALIEHEERLLLAQLARGRFAGFWLLPSATVEQDTVAETAWQLLPFRTGVTPSSLELRGVQEEMQTGALALRFVFAGTAAPGGPHADGDIARVGWLTRDAVCELLAERELVPTLGVLHLARAWAGDITLPPLVALDESKCTVPADQGSTTVVVAGGI